MEIKSLGTDSWDLVFNCGHILIPVQLDMRQCEENTWNVYMVTHNFGTESKLNYEYNVLFLFHDDGLGPESAGGLPNQSV